MYYPTWSAAAVIFFLYNNKAINRFQRIFFKFWYTRLAVLGNDLIHSLGIINLKMAFEICI